MNGHDRSAGYVPNPRYSQEDWDEVSDNPELTDAELAQLRPAREVLPPDLFAALSARGEASSRVPVTLSVDAATLDAFKATGEGWKSRMNKALDEASKRLRR